MTLDQIQVEKDRLAQQVNLAVRQFRERCGLQEWQIDVSWGQVQVSVQVGNGPKSAPHDDYMASVTVRV